MSAPYPNTNLSEDQQGQNNQQQQQQSITPPSTTEESEGMQIGDILTYIRKNLSYWYLFVIGAAIALTAAHYKNKRWTPIYQTKAQVMIDEGKFGSGLMSGFSVQQGYRNVNNQIILFGSRDLIRRAINKLPFTVNCYTRTKYKTESLYGRTPVTIIDEEITPLAYGKEYIILDNNDNTSYTIAWKEGEQIQKATGKYGFLSKFPLFTIKVELNDRYYPGFRFRFTFQRIDDLIADYSGRLSFDFVMQGSSVLNVGTSSGDYLKDIDFINALCEEFLQLSLDRKNEAAEKTINFIDSQMGSVTDSLIVSERDLKRYRMSNNIMDMSSYSSEVMNDNKKYENQKETYETRRKYFNYVLNLLDNNNGKEIIAVPQSVGISDGTLASFIGRYNDLVLKKMEIGEKNPYYAKYNEQMEQLRMNVIALTNNMRYVMDMEERELERKTRENRAQIIDLPDKQREMGEYERRFNFQDKYYTYLLQRRSESEVQKASNVADNLIVERARTLGVINGDEQASTETLYLAIGLLIPLAFALFRIFMNDKVEDKRDIEKHSPYPYFGSIRHSKSKSRIPVQNNPRSGLAESYRVIRTRIEFVLRRSHPTMILITSAESGDGKTTFALNFAAMYAHTKRKTLLIDLDLRKPSLIDRLNLPNDKRIGLSNYLIDQIEDWHDLIIRNDRYNFDMIYGGTVPPNPGELIRSEKLTKLLEILKQEYDHIVIDTSPIGLVADAYSMMFNVDCNIFITRSEKTNKNFFRSILQQLKTDKVQKLFVVLNDVDHSKASYYNYHEYGRRSYYMRKDEYHNYTQEYFKEDEDDGDEQKKASLWKRMKTKFKELKKEYY